MARRRHRPHRRGRPGRRQLTHRELSRLPLRPQRPRPHPEGHPVGAEFGASIQPQSRLRPQRRRGIPAPLNPSPSSAAPTPPDKLRSTSPPRAAWSPSPSAAPTSPPRCRPTSPTVSTPSPSQCLAAARSCPAEASSVHPHRCPARPAAPRPGLCSTGPRAAPVRDQRDCRVRRGRCPTRLNETRRVASAVGEGASAIRSIHTAIGLRLSRAPECRHRGLRSPLPCRRWADNSRGVFANDARGGASDNTPRWHRAGHLSAEDQSAGGGGWATRPRDASRPDTRGVTRR